MSVALFQQLKGKNDPLVTVPLNSMVALHPWSPGATYIPANICDPTSGALQGLQPGWSTGGELQKKAGIDITPDRKTSDVEGAGSLVPRRTVITSEGVSIDYTAQEWRKVNMSVFYGVDMSQVWVNPTSGEWRAHKSASPIQQYFSMIVLAFDGLPSSEVYPFWIFPKVACPKVGKISLVDGSEMAFPSTLTIYEDNAYVSSDGYVGPLYDFGVAGLGNIALAKDAGFTQVTSITVSPSTKTLTHSPVQTQQLTVTDSNGLDVTAWCSFSSGTPADATVSAGGFVTAVATGSSVITASYTPYGATTALTGTCTVTVS